MYLIISFIIFGGILCSELLLSFGCIPFALFWSYTIMINLMSFKLSWIKIASVKGSMDCNCISMFFSKTAFSLQNPQLQTAYLNVMPSNDSTSHYFVY